MLTAERDGLLRKVAEAERASHALSQLAGDREEGAQAVAVERSAHEKTKREIVQLQVGAAACVGLPARPDLLSSAALDCTAGFDLQPGDAECELRAAAGVDSKVSGGEEHCVRSAGSQEPGAHAAM